MRAEYTISMRNSKRLDELFRETKIPGFMKPLAKKGIGMLENLQAAEKEYRMRLEKNGDRKLSVFGPADVLPELPQSITAFTLALLAWHVKIKSSEWGVAKW